MIFKLFRNELVGILPLVTYIISPLSFQLLLCPPPTPPKCFFKFYCVQIKSERDDNILEIALLFSKRGKTGVDMPLHVLF